MTCIENFVLEKMIAEATTLVFVIADELTLCGECKLSTYEYTRIRTREHNTITKYNA